MAAVSDWVETREELDRTRSGLLGSSLGGYFAARTVAFEKRIKAKSDIYVSCLVCPLYSLLKQVMVANSILDDLKRNNDVSPERNAFIQITSSGAGRNPKDTPSQPTT